MGTIGVVVCGHGSRDSEAVKEFESLIQDLARHFPDHPLTHGFLEFAQPTIEDALENLRLKGAGQILAVPAMLFAGGHVTTDVPAILDEFASNYDGLTIRFGRELGLDPNLMKAAADRIDEEINNASKQIPLEETLLMVVGRGTTDSNINDALKQICRALCEELKFDHGEVCYAGVASPLVEPGLENAAQLGYRRIVVFPYLLLTGMLVNRIYSITDQIALKFPDVEFLKAKYLGNHPNVIETFADRIREIL